MKFSGTIGFWRDDVEVSPGVYRPQIEEKRYKGELLSNRRTNQDSGNQNDEFVVNQKISILADLYLKKNWPLAKYVTIDGVMLKVKSGDINYPRVALELGGIWNGSNETRSS